MHLTLIPGNVETRQRCGRVAAFGAVVWVIWGLLIAPPWPEALVALAALVHVPLGLGLLPQSGRIDLLDYVRRWQLPAALVLLAAHSVEPGLGAFLLALPWLAFTLAAALCAAQRRWARGFGSAAELTIDAGWLFLAVGGVWSVIARGGIRPLGFDPLIVRLTAVHFHYAGFALPILTGLSYRHIPCARLPVRRLAPQDADATMIVVGREIGPMGRAATAGVIAGVPLVAAGITLASVTLELAATAVLTTASLLTAAMQVRQAVAARRAAPLWLLLASSVALLGGMILAMAYALGRYFGTPWIEIPEMIVSHGLLNAVGFSLLGLCGWHALLREGQAR
jgi:hypothetical protein